MKFKSGYLGICIVVLALLLGTAGSLLLNVDKTPQATTKYDYVTDISGLFTSSQEPQYIDFNPASNITGYYPYPSSPTPSGLDYVPSPTTNNYRVTSVSGSTHGGASGTIDNSSSYAQKSFSGGSYYSFYSQGGGDEWFRGYKITYLSTFLTTVFGDLSQYSSITLSLAYPGGHWDPYTTQDRTTWGFIAYGEQGGLSAQGGGTSLKGAFFDYLYIDTVNGTYTASFMNYPEYVSDVFSIYTSYIGYGDATYYYRPYNDALTSTSKSLSLSFTSTVTTIPQYEYIDPSQGVRCVDGYNTRIWWSNDPSLTQYKDVSISIILGPSMTDGMPNSDTPWKTYLYVEQPDGDLTTITIRHKVTDGVGKMYATCSIDDYPTNIYPIPFETFIGNYDYVLVNFDIRDTPTVTIYPVVDFVNYTNFTTLDAPIASASIMPPDGYQTLDSIYMESENYTGGRWLVSDTVVFMNTYNSVLIDPSINLADYWPDMNSYRFAFQSFAIYGDSITMNGVTYPIIDNNKIVIDDKTYTLDNFYLSFSEQDKTSITFKNINRTVDLGDTVDKTVSFDGIWYFSTALYEGSLTTEDVYEWDDNLIGNIDVQLVLLITLGLLLGLSLLMVALLHVNLSLMDKVVLVFAGAVILCIIGGF